jgi:hypothetical protein
MKVAMALYVSDIEIDRLEYLLNCFENVGASIPQTNIEVILDFFLYGTLSYDYISILHKYFIKTIILPSEQDIICNYDVLYFNSSCGNVVGYNTFKTSNIEEFIDEIKKRIFISEISRIWDGSNNFCFICSEHMQDRIVDNDDLLLYNTVRQTFGTVIISGGQTGVDQIALEQASRISIPAFAIVPNGKRVEGNNEIECFSARLIELNNCSYKYRTWLNVYLSDGVILCSLFESEGTQSTLQAAKYFNRPVFIIDPAKEYSEIIKQVKDWIALYGIKIIDVAGHRQSYLGSTIYERVSDILFHIFKSIVPYGKLEALKYYKRNKKCLIGFPENARLKNLLSVFINECSLNIKTVNSHIWSSTTESDIKFIFIRSNDLPQMLYDSHLDAILCGDDIIYESRYAFNKLFSTGFFASIICTINHPDQEIKSIASQYPRYAQENYPDKELMYITGCAEPYVSLNIVDAIVDTWQTGKTASQYGLTISKIIDTTCFSFYINKSCNLSTFNLIKRFYDWQNGSGITGQSVLS